MATTLDQLLDQIEAKAKAAEEVPDPDPWFQHSPDPAALVECQKCAALVQVTSVGLHRRWHEAYD